MLSSLARAKENGAKIVSINPLPEVGNFHFKNPQDLKNPLRAAGVFFGVGASLSDLWLPVRINGDVAVLKGMRKKCWPKRKGGPAPSSIMSLSGLPPRVLRSSLPICARRIGTTFSSAAGSSATRSWPRRGSRAIKAHHLLLGDGIDPAPERGSRHSEIINFLLLGGNIGRQGAGPCPVRGHSNVQGDRTMGIWNG